MDAFLYRYARAHYSSTGMTPKLGGAFGPLFNNH